MANSPYSTNKKAAMLVVALGKETAAKIYKYLSDEEIEQLTIAITTMERFGNEERNEVVGEFYEICLAQKYVAESGVEYARAVLVAAIGEERADNVLAKLSASLQVRPFDFVRKTDSVQVVNFIQNEHPQTIAFVMSYLEAKQAASILSSLEQDVQARVIRCIAQMGVVSPEYIHQAEMILERKLMGVGTSDNIAVGGIDAIIGILNLVDRGTESFILSAIEKEDPELSEEIHNKLFVFEDIGKLSSTALQIVLRDVDNDALAVALKGATNAVSQKIFANISKRLQDILRENMEFMGPVRVRDVEAAQQKIVNIIRHLEDAGQIEISRGGHEDEIVN